MSTPNQPGKDEKRQSPPPASTSPQQGQKAQSGTDSAPQKPAAASGRPPLPPLPPRQSATAPSSAEARPSSEAKPSAGANGSAGQSSAAPASRPAEGSGQQSVRGTQAPPWQRGPGAQGATPGQQREPQTNLKRPEKPKSGAAPQQAPTQQAPKQAPATGQQAAPGRPSGQAPASSTAKQGQAPTGAAPRVTTPQSGTAPRSAPPQKGAAPSSKGAPQSAPATGAQPTPAQQRAVAKAKAAGIDGPTRHIDRKSLPKDMPDLSEAKHPLPVDKPSSTGQQPKVTAVAMPQRVAEGEPLRASVQIRKIDPWSMLKISSVISVSLFFVWMVAVGLLYIVLDGMGVWDRLNNAFTDIVSTSGAEGLITAGQVFGYASVIGLVNMVLFTALATIGSFIYNMCSDLVGGIEATLADRD